MIDAREYNLAIARQKAFGKILLADLASIKASIVRIHDSGDFFSQTYLDCWIAAAVAYPEKTFYAYTKSLHLDFSSVPANFRITQSMGGKLDADIDTSKPHSRIFATHADRKAAGYGDGSNTDTLAIRGANKIGLVYHGSRNLTEAQAEYFS